MIPYARYASAGLLAALSVAPARGAVTLEAGGDAPWRVTAAAYRATVSPDGSLAVDAGGGALVKSLMLYRGNDRVSTRVLARDGDGALAIREGADAAAPAADAPGLKLVFRDDGIDIAPLNLPDAEKNGNTAYTLYCGLGDEAVGISNVVLSVEDALPTTRFAEPHIFSFYDRVGNCWPDVDILGADGSRLSLRGITGVRPARAYRIFPEELDRATPNGVAAVPFAGDRPVALAVARGPARAARRASVPSCTVAPLHPHGLYPVREPARFRLAFPDDAPAGRYRLEWTMEDHVQRPLGKGSATFALGDGTKEALVDIVPATAPPGYVYARAWLVREGVPSARRHLTFEFGRCAFENDLLDEFPPWDVSGEIHLMNVLGFRGLRLYASVPSVWLENHDRDNPERIDWNAFKEKWRGVLAYCARGSVRRPMMLMEGNGVREVDDYFRNTYGKAAPAAGEGADPDKAWKARRDETMARWYREFGAAAQELGLLWWEPWNEPDLQMPHERYINEILKPVYDNFKAGGPDINLLGGSCCGIDKQPWLARLYELDENGRHFDGISFHPYGGVGFQRIYRMHLARWQKLFADHGDDPSQGLFITEGSFHRGWGYNDYVYDRFAARRESNAHTGLHMMLHAEAAGIPRERIYVFYACEHGYNDFYLVRRDSPTPSAVAFQVMNAALGDAAFEKEVPLPGHDRFFHRYRGDGRTVAVLFTGGDAATVRVATDAREVTVTDCMGVAKRVKPSRGVVEVAFDGFPVYLRAPEGARLEPVYDGLKVRPNLALAALGAAVTAEAAKDPGSPDADVLIDGDWTGYAGGCWNERPEGSDVFPDIFEIRLPAPRAIGSVTVYHQYGAWERTLSDYDVEAFVGGAWKKVAGLRGNFYAEVTAHDFRPVKTDRVRLAVTGVNSSLFGRIDWIRHQTALRAIEVRAAPERPAKAFFADGVLDKPWVAKGAPLALEYRLVNATASEVSGELRFTLPEGWRADPVPVRIPARGEATVRATLHAGETGGRVTALAALCDAAGNMISSDYDARVVDVQ